LEIFYDGRKTTPVRLADDLNQTVEASCKAGFDKPEGGHGGLHVNKVHVIADEQVKAGDTVHIMTTEYTRDDDVIHLCCSCGFRLSLGFSPTTYAVANAAAEHLAKMLK